MALDSSRRRDFLILAAQRQERERQIGADCSKGYLESADAGLLFDGPQTLECFFRHKHEIKLQRPAGFSGDSMELSIPGSTDTLVLYCGGSHIEASLVDGHDYHVVLTYDGIAAIAYLNGTLISSFTPTNYVVPPSFRIGNSLYPPKGPVYFCRHYNYALSAKEVVPLYNNGDPAGYVLPGAYKRSGNSYVSNFTTSTERWAALDGSILTYDEANHVLELDSAANRYAHMFSPVSYDTRDSHVYDIEVVIDANPKVTKCDFYPYTATELITLPVEYLEETTVFRGVYIPGSRNSFSDKIYCYFSLSTPTIVRVRSIRVLPVGCVAEYLPQNIIISRKRDFPQVTIPIVGYTQSSGVFLINSTSVTTQVMNAPQANGFSGKHMRFDAVTGISLYCAYWYTYLKKRLPIKITFEYRANRTIYASQQSTAPTAPDAVAIDANEDDAQIASVIYGVGGSAYIFSAADTEAWLEMRVLAIEVVEDVCLGWLDSAKQLPLNDEYLAPLLENINGYDLTANGTPEIVCPESSLWYGIEYDVTKDASSCVRIGDMSLHQHLPIQSRMRGCLLDDNGKVIEYLPSADWTGTARDGSRGQVMIEIPRHYRKHETEGNIRRTKISEYPLPGYHAVPKMYISAYEASMERSTGKLCSVANSSPDFRGGNDNAAWDSTYRSLLGRPVTAKSRTTFRNAARLRNASATSEWNCLDYNAYKAVFWLYYVEYANRNCQLAFNAQKDASGFAQGGLGGGVVNTTDWDRFNDYYPFVPCGYTDDLGNASGEVAYVMTKEDGSPYGTVYVNRYRGIENPFGHLWKCSDGINIQIASEADGGTSKVYVSDDPAKYNDSNYIGYTLRGLEARELGYVKELAFGEFGDIMPAVVGDGSTTCWADYHYTSIPASGVALRSVLFGGNANSGTLAGFGFAYSSNAPSLTSANVGSRLCFIPKK